MDDFRILDAMSSPEPVAVAKPIAAAIEGKAALRKATVQLTEKVIEEVDLRWQRRRPHLR